MFIHPHGTRLKAPARDPNPMGADERTAVKTYVPASQKEAWRAHAAEMDMTQSEFVKAMVQAGRRGFDPAPEEGGSSGSSPGGDGLRTRLLEVLDDGDVYTWEQLRNAMVADLEDRLEGALRDLQSAGRVAYSGRDGGYVRTDE